MFNTGITRTRKNMKKKISRRMNHVDVYNSYTMLSRSKCNEYKKTYYPGPSLKPEFIPKDKRIYTKMRKSHRISNGDMGYIYI